MQVKESLWGSSLQCDEFSIRIFHENPVGKAVWLVSSSNFKNIFSRKYTINENENTV